MDKLRQNPGESDSDYKSRILQSLDGLTADKIKNKMKAVGMGAKHNGKKADLIN
jgi:hypothetical protein